MARHRVQLERIESVESLFEEHEVRVVEAPLRELARARPWMSTQATWCTGGPTVHHDVKGADAASVKVAGTAEVLVGLGKAPLALLGALPRPAGAEGSTRPSDSCSARRSQGALASLLDAIAAELLRVGESEYTHRGTEALLRVGASCHQAPRRGLRMTDPRSLPISSRVPASTRRTRDAPSACARRASCTVREQ